MILISALVLAAFTLMPGAARTGTPITGYLSAPVSAANSNCKPGAICSSVKTKLHGCLVVNFWNNSEGGTPLAIDVTQTGAKGTPTWVYWVNNTNKTLTIKGAAYAKYFC